MPSLAQRRAQHALERINGHVNSGPGVYGKYVSYVSALPAMILMNGLGQSAATLLSQNNIAGYQQLFEDLENWLCGADEAAPYRHTNEGLMQAIVNSDEATYLKAQTEALAYLIWLKKLANAQLEAGD